MSIVEKLRQIKYKDWIKGVVSKEVSWELVLDLMKEMKSTSFRHLFVQLHDEDWKDLLQKCRSFAEMSESSGIPREWLAHNLRKYGYLPEGLGVKKTKTFAERMKGSIFRGEEFDELESYVYGYYLGDGWTSVSRPGGIPNGMYIVCMDSRDLENFDKFTDLIGGHCSYSDGSHTAQINDSLSIANLNKYGLLYISKSVKHGEFTRGQLDRFNFMTLLRGLIDTDGNMCYIGTSSGRSLQRVRIQIVWKNLLETLYKKLLDLGVECYLYEGKGGANRQQLAYSLDITRFGLVKLLDLGYYSWRPDIELERKRIQDWRLVYPELPKVNTGNSFVNGGLFVKSVLGDTSYQDLSSVR